MNWRIGALGCGAASHPHWGSLAASRGKACASKGKACAAASSDFTNVASAAWLLVACPPPGAWACSAVKLVAANTRNGGRLPGDRFVEEVRPAEVVVLFLCFCPKSRSESNLSASFSCGVAWPILLYFDFFSPSCVPYSQLTLYPRASICMGRAQSCVTTRSPSIPRRPLASDSVRARAGRRSLLHLLSCCAAVPPPQVRMWVHEEQVDGRWAQVGLLHVCARLDSEAGSLHPEDGSGRHESNNGGGRGAPSSPSRLSPFGGGRGGLRGCPLCGRGLFCFHPCGTHPCPPAGA